MRSTVALGWVPALVLGLMSPAVRPASAQSLFVVGGPGSEVGASVRDVEPADRQPRGVRIDQIRPGSPAAEAGLRVDDLVVEFDGESVRSSRQFARLVRETPPGREVGLTVMRDGRSTALVITPRTGRFVDGDRLRERLDRLRDWIPFELNGGPPAARQGLGITVQDMTPQLAAYFDVADGVLVTAVRPDSPASRAGLAAGDVIVSIDQTPVRSRGQLLRRLRTSEGELSIATVRDGESRTVTATIP